jgi:hypothetical protein
MWQTKFRTHRKVQSKQQFCIFHTCYRYKNGRYRILECWQPFHEFISSLFICECNFYLLLSFQNIRHMTHSGALPVFYQEMSRCIRQCLNAVTLSFDDQIFGFAALNTIIITSFMSTVSLNVSSCPGLCTKIF